jgi:hypothetical protein
MGNLFLMVSLILKNTAARMMKYHLRGIVYPFAYMYESRLIFD